MKGNWLRRQRSNPGRRQILPRNITINNLDKRRAFRSAVTLMYHMRNRHKGEYVTYLKLWEIYISIILLITKVFYWHKIKYPAMKNIPYPTINAKSMTFNYCRGCYFGESPYRHTLTLAMDVLLLFFAISDVSSFCHFQEKR